MELSPGELQEILKLFVESELQELHLQVGDVTLQVSKNESNGLPTIAVPQSPRSQASVPSAPAPAAPPSMPGASHATAEPAVPPGVDRSGLHALRSPSVGVFYRRPGPDQPPYVEVGDIVRVGDPVCTVSVMKMFTQVGADRAGRVVEICVENETLVEHNEILMYIEPLEEG
jgi:acetyl-CoA carboxylase biotin carboxyl carrier protein